MAIMVVFAKADVKQSLRIRVNLDARYGTCLFPILLSSRARMHSFKASKDVLISALSVRRCEL